MFEYVLEFSPSLACLACGGSLGNDVSQVSDRCGRCNAPTDMARYKDHWRAYIDTTLRAESDDPGQIGSGAESR